MTGCCHYHDILASHDNVISKTIKNHRMNSKLLKIIRRQLTWNVISMLCLYGILTGMIKKHILRTEEALEKISKLAMLEQRIVRFVRVDVCMFPCSGDL
jgi:hypothetical protein